MTQRRDARVRLEVADAPDTIREGLEDWQRVRRENPGLSEDEGIIIVYDGYHYHLYDIQGTVYVVDRVRFKLQGNVVTHEEYSLDDGAWKQI